MNLLTDNFISTTAGKISLKELLTSQTDYQLQYAFDETQLATLQLLASLTTVVLKPTLDELKAYLKHGLTETQYDQVLKNLDLSWFDEKYFMKSPISGDSKVYTAPVTKLVSGIECGSSGDALGLFSEVSQADIVCQDCMPILNYNLHMNIKGECFSKFGATGIRGGSISTLIAGNDLKTTILSNTIAIDYFNSLRGIEKPNNKLMWQDALQGDIYYAHHIGLERGLFALAYHIDYSVLDENCICDVCGHLSSHSVSEYRYLKYTGSYGSTKKGRDRGAQWWPHPYTPTIKNDKGVFPVCARDQNWQSWQNFSSYIIGKETEKSLSTPAFIMSQYRKLAPGNKANLLVGGNIASKGSVKGRVYDLYSMPEHWNNDKLERVTKVIDTGFNVKDRLSQALNKMFGAGYDKNFVSGIKNSAINQYISNAQNIVQQLLLDVDRKEAITLRKEALTQLKNEAKVIYHALRRKYQSDLPLFKSLAKGERLLMAVDKVKT